MAKKKDSQKAQIAELEQEVQQLREHQHRAKLYFTRIITFNPLSLPPNKPGGKLGLVRSVEKQKSLAIKGLVALEPDSVKAQEYLDKYGVADGSDPEA